jgi:hypothetical protein
MISLVFIILASICNAVMDVISHHYYTSIFAEYNKYWWNPYYSWKNKYINGEPMQGRVKISDVFNFPKWVIRLVGDFNYPVQFTDAWHLFKMFMIIFIVLSIVTFDLNSVIGKYIHNPIVFILLIASYGLCWNLTFTLFYKHLLKK